MRRVALPRYKLLVGIKFSLRTRRIVILQITIIGEIIFLLDFIAACRRTINFNIFSGISPFRNLKSDTLTALNAVWDHLRFQFQGRIDKCVPIFFV